MIVAFLYAIVASFLGSVPPGPSNLAVLHTVLNSNTKAGFRMALGAALVELPYSFLAILAIQYVSYFESVRYWLELAAAIILITAGIYIFLSHKGEDVDHTTRVERSNFPPFLKGVMVALLNPMLVGFWLVASQVGVSLDCVDPHSLPDKLGFVLGTAVGAFALLAVVTLSTKKIKEYLSPKLLHYLNQGIAIAFLAIGIVQGVKSYLDYHHIQL